MSGFGKAVSVILRRRPCVLDDLNFASETFSIRPGSNLLSCAALGPVLGRNDFRRGRLNRMLAVQEAGRSCAN